MARALTVVMFGFLLARVTVSRFGRTQCVVSPSRYDEDNFTRRKQRKFVQIGRSKGNEAYKMERSKSTYVSHMCVRESGWKCCYQAAHCMVRLGGVVSREDPLFIRLERFVGTTRRGIASCKIVNASALLRALTGSVTRG